MSIDTLYPLKGNAGRRVRVVRNRYVQEGHSLHITPPQHIKGVSRRRPGEKSSTTSIRLLATKVK